MNVILLGPPGAGKGTQAKRVAAAVGALHFSTGDAFRSAIAAGSELGKKVEPIMKAGGLVSDELVIALVDERLTKPDCANGVVFDGYPRTIPQADALAATLKRLGRPLDKVVELQVPDEAIVERMSGRRSCPRDGSVYHVTANPPQRAGVCDKCGAELVVRDDDKPETVLKRQAKYHQDTAPLISYYRPQGLLVPVDGVGTPDEVAARIRQALGR